MNKDQKITVMVGVSGSGKSTIVADCLADNPNTICVSRDAVRMLLYAYNESNLYQYYAEPNLKEMENKVSDFCDTLIRKALRKGKDVIVDNTHLRVEYIRAYKNYGVKIEMHIVNESIDIIHDRNVGRSKFVHVDVLNRQHKQFLSLMERIDTIDKEMCDFNGYVDVLWETSSKIDYSVDKRVRDCYIFDIDGTLAHMTGRSTHDYSRVLEDALDKSVVDTLWAIARSEDAPDIVIYTGRDGGCLDGTKEWLDTNVILYDKIYIREHGDTRKDWIVKAEFWADIQKTHNIIAMYDDRTQVVDFARRLGHKVYQVAPGDF